MINSPQFQAGLNWRLSNSSWITVKITLLTFKAITTKKQNTSPRCSATPRILQSSSRNHMHANVAKTAVASHAFNIITLHLIQDCCLQSCFSHYHTSSHPRLLSPVMLFTLSHFISSKTVASHAFNIITLHLIQDCCRQSCFSHYHTSSHPRLLSPVMLFTLSHFISSKTAVSSHAFHITLHLIQDCCRQSCFSHYHTSSHPRLLSQVMLFTLSHFISSKTAVSSRAFHFITLHLIQDCCRQSCFSHYHTSSHPRLLSPVMLFTLSHFISSKTAVACHAFHIITLHLI